ncbi:MAG: recombination protein RecR [Ignavibacteria bacterium]|nr:recombination protein RecR [Bacteroidota bacterium]MSQ45510.1 recombination protein RecR [Ignavibacteria bacterium]
MIYTSESFEQLVEHFAQLPGIGKKTAQRLALYILKMPHESVSQFASSLINVKNKIRYCTTCCNITEQNPCPICTNSKRDSSLICVVEEPNDVLALERTNEYHGLYHVLGGALSPLDNITPENLKIKELLLRLEKNDVEEIILALNPTVEGETTSLYLSRLLKPLGMKLSRIARGIPIGASLEFTDDATLSRALEGRVAI